MVLTSSKQSVSAASCRIFIFGLAFLWNNVQGEYQLIGLDEPIIAALGQDVVLPCHLEPKVDLLDRAVEWSKPDLSRDPPPRPNRITYVHLYRNGREIRDIMTPAYIGRTSLFADGLKHGDMSLTISNVTTEDEGVFRCFIPYLWRSATVRLVLDTNIVRTSTAAPSPFPINLITPEPEDKTLCHTSGCRSRFTILIPAGVFFTVILLSAGICLFKQRRQRQNSEAASSNTSRVQSGSRKVKLVL